MISVNEALANIFALVEPLDTEIVPLQDCDGRVLVQNVIARRSQPPFRASIMDGYAVRDGAERYRVIGEAAAGHRFAGTLGPAEAVRIFTGAPVPDGADRVIIQEDVVRTGDEIALKPDSDDARYIRDIGADFSEGDTLPAPRRLTPSDVALLAAMNIAEVPVVRRPTVALIATGDELVMPGEHPTVDQIIASNNLGLAALLRRGGAIPRILPIARDTLSSLAEVFRLASGADLIVTIGGASVGDHDLVAEAAAAHGMDRSFYKVAMRPGKPLMAGKIGNTPMIGLPGNPVSAMVCGHIFLRPVIRAMSGLEKAAMPRQDMILAAPLSANGPREHYMRAAAQDGQVRAADRQDSALLRVLADANALIVRPPSDGPRDVGDTVQVVALAAS